VCADCVPDCEPTRGPPGNGWLNPRQSSLLKSTRKTNPKQRPRVPHVCRFSCFRRQYMARKTGQIIRRGPQMWMVRIYVGRDPETRKRTCIGNPSTADCAPHRPISTTCSLSGTLAATSGPQRQTLGEYLDHWLDICARPRLRAKSFRDYSTLLARYVRSRLGARPLGELSAVEIQALYGELLTRSPSPTAPRPSRP
jgi:hypothetical protein